MSQTSQPAQPSPSNHSSLRTVAVVGLVLVAVLSLAFAGYTVQNTHSATVTQQQLLTNTQSLTNTVTVTNVMTAIATSSTTITSISTTTSTASNVYGYWYYPSYPYYPYYPDCGASCPPTSNYLNNYNTCNLNSPHGSNVFQCYGYIYQDSGGCVILTVPMPNPPYYFENPVTHYYGLHNLPSNLPPMGTWVTVTGQWNEGNNTSSSGTACPFNYLNVTSITR